MGKHEKGIKHIGFEKVAFANTVKFLRETHLQISLSPSHAHTHTHTHTHTHIHTYTVKLTLQVTLELIDRSKICKPLLL